MTIDRLIWLTLSHLPKNSYNLPFYLQILEIALDTKQLLELFKFIVEICSFYTSSAKQEDYEYSEHNILIMTLKTNF